MKKPSDSGPGEVRYGGHLARRQQVELEYLRNVENARERYEDVRRQYTGFRDLAGSVGSDARQDGTLAFARSQQAYNVMMQALEEYRSELHRFTRLVVDRIDPDHD